MKNFKRLLPLLLVFWGWACQTSTTDLQPRTMPGARQQTSQGKIHKVKPRPGLRDKTKQNGDPSVLSDRNEHYEQRIAEMNADLDEIETDGNPILVDEANAEVDYLNSVSDDVFQNMFQRVRDMMNRMLAYIRCQAYSRPNIGPN